jgi:ABC-type branched-subunit amino acid transport system substrate-binding protein
LLLPLSGGDSAAQAIARDMQDAARMAVDETAGLGAIDLRIRDSGTSAATASAAASAAKAEGVPIVVGPAFAEEAQAVAGVAQTSGIPVLALSSFASYADPPLYILGLHPEDEVNRILGYAASQGLTRIGVVLPQNLYGEVVGGAVDRAANRFGLSIVHRLTYPYSAQGSQQAITDGAPALAAAAPDAVLVPEDNGQVLTWILSFLALGDVRAGQQQFLGLSGWETGGGLRAPELVGGWYAAPDGAALADFNARFAARFGRQPSRPAAVAYDAISAVSQMIAGARRSGQSAFSPAALTAQAGFQGATGRFRLRPDGVVARDLVIMEVGPNGAIPRAGASPAGS